MSDSLAVSRSDEHLLHVFMTVGQDTHIIDYFQVTKVVVVGEEGGGLTSVLSTPITKNQVVEIFCTLKTRLHSVRRRVILVLKAHWGASVMRRLSVWTVVT